MNARYIHVILLCSMLLSTSSTAWAEPNSKVIETDDSTETTLGGRGLVPYLPIGILLGSSLSEKGGFLLGFETSLVWFEDQNAYWFGFTTDVLRDFGYDQTRATFGLEAGYWVFGLEASLAYAYKAQDHVFGARFGVVSAFGPMSFFARYTKQFDDRDDQIVELGILLKAPIPLF